MFEAGHGRQDADVYSWQCGRQPNILPRPYHCGKTIHSFISRAVLDISIIYLQNSDVQDLSARFKDKTMCNEIPLPTSETEYLKFGLVCTPLVVIAIFFSYLCKDFVKLQLKTRARRQNSNAWLEVTYSSKKERKEQYHKSISVDTITSAALVAPDASNQA